MIENDKRTIDQKTFDKWTKAWRMCKCAELPDCFHTESIDESNKEEYLLRRSKFYLSKDEWLELIQDRLTSIHIHMSVEHKENGTSRFVPILEPVLTFEPLNNEGKEKRYYPFKEDPPLVIEGQISEELKSQLVTNWMYLHPGFMVDQFESIKDPNEQGAAKMGKQLKPIERQRVKFYQYDSTDIEKMRAIGENFNYIIFHLGVNHNDDSFGLPSFAPVLHFFSNQEESKSRSRALNSADNLYFEFATPCPPLCN
ncbi:MAG: hypothetical protein R8P61_17705 [Bacteroidia bacterium]|nr:hypothetical protein [Bacteroidia bacterium]